MKDTGEVPVPRFAYDKPLPTIEPGTQPYWNGLRSHKLIYQKCRTCGYEFAPYQTICRSCWSDDLEDRTSIGRGKVYTFSIVHRAPLPAFRPDVPYAVAIVELDEGFFLTTNLVGCPVDKIEIGMPVEIEYVDVTEQITLPKFKPRL